MSDPDLPVECANHGTTPSCYVCTHIFDGEGVGFFEAFEPDEEDPWPDAWCAACEDRLEAEGEWTDELMNVASIRVLCTHCYEDARGRNRRQ